MLSTAVRLLTAADRPALLGAAAVVIYAAMAGFRTISSHDLFWQLRDARYLVETGNIARRDVFSYTATGQPWMYPQGAGLLFYGLYCLGGYVAVSLLGLVTCAATTATLLAVRPGVLAAALVGLAVPQIAMRTVARAEMFTILFFALFLVLLFRGVAERHLWLLPLLMGIWVNLHPGFLAGFGLIALFLAGARLTGARVRKLAYIGVLCLLATFLNPFGPGVWKIPWRQAQQHWLHQRLVIEWWPSSWSWWRLEELLEWRDPSGAYWVLLFVCLVAACLGLRRKRWDLVVLLAGVAATSLYSQRLQVLLGMAVAACVPGLVAGSQVRLRLRWTAVAALVLLVTVRVSDLASNRYYFSRGTTATMGAGISYVFPEQAAEFVLRERLPGRLLHDLPSGDYLGWKLGHGYPIFIDGRSIPFGHELVLEHAGALRLPPDSPEWQAFADRWGIQTVFLGIGWNREPLRRFCETPNVHLVYLDAVSAVFLRDGPATRPWTEMLGKSCNQVILPAPLPGEPAYVFHRQAARLYFELGRHTEAWAAVEQARRDFAGDPELFVQAGLILAALGKPAEARRELLAGTALPGSSRVWFTLGLLEREAGRHKEAIRALERATRTGALPHEAYRLIAESRLALGQPRQALVWFERALRSRQAESARYILGAAFAAAVRVGEARAKFALGDATGTEGSLRAAVEAFPSNAQLHLMLAEFYAGHGQTAQALAALEQAQSLGASGPMFEALQNRLHE